MSNTGSIVNRSEEITDRRRSSDGLLDVVHQSIQYDGNAIAPHGNTVRSSYTVPTNYLAKVTSVFGMVVRRAAAAPVGQVVLNIISVETVPLIKLKFWKNAIGDDAVASFGESGIESIGGGTGFEIDTSDGGTGGTMDYSATVKFIQYPIRSYRI